MKRSGARGSGIAFAAAFVVVVLGLFLALGGAAYAQQTPSGDEYEEEENVNVFTPPTAKDPGARESESGVVAETLPFSGLSLLGAAVLGLALVATGVLLRRRGRET